MPRASTITAVRVNPGVLNSWRKAKRRSWIIGVMSLVRFINRRRHPHSDAGGPVVGFRFFRFGRVPSCTSLCSRYLRRGYPDMRIAGIFAFISLLTILNTQPASGASREQRMVTRVDTATVALSHGGLVIHAEGMARNPTAMGRGGRVVPRGNRTLNKDGLLEYELVFNGVPNYTGFKLKPIKGSYRERSVPQGIKGVRIFAEFNQMDAHFPEAKKHKSLIPSFGNKKQKAADSETTGAITGGTPRP